MVRVLGGTSIGGALQPAWYINLGGVYYDDEYLYMCARIDRRPLAQHDQVDQASRGRRPGHAEAAEDRVQEEGGRTSILAAQAAADAAGATQQNVVFEHARAVAPHSSLLLE